MATLNFDDLFDKNGLNKSINQVKQAFGETPISRFYNPTPRTGYLSESFGLSVERAQELQTILKDAANTYLISLNGGKPFSNHDFLVVLTKAGDVFKPVTASELAYAFFMIGQANGKVVDRWFKDN